MEDYIENGPGEVICDVHPQELNAAPHLHISVVDGKRSEAELILAGVKN